MARKAKRRPLRASKTATVQTNDISEVRSYHASTVIHPSTTMGTPHKRRCGLARSKQAAQHQTQQPKTEPTLGDRFHALPAELRAEIFSLLLVRPVKWQLPHQLEPRPCPLTLNCWSIYPDINYSGNSATCVRCFVHIHSHDRIPLWRNLQDPDHSVAKWNRKAGGLGHEVWQNPWRSQWAPPVANEFICSECWDLEFRPRPHPAQEAVLKRHLRCLCARRQNLSILLVSRQWYEEAGAVFYARNTYAFESGKVFTSFITSLPQRWRDKISRVSIMAHHPDTDDLAGAVEETSGWEGNRKLAVIFPLLHKLPQLSYLELDAHFLSRPKTAHRLLRLSLQNVRRVCFVMHNPFPSNSRGSEWIWPEYHSSRLLVGGFAEEVARAIKGQKPRRSLRKQHFAIQEACERQEVMEATIMELDAEAPNAHEQGMGCGNVYFSASKSAYARLWWQEQKHFTAAGGGKAAHFSRGNGLHAYISTEYTHFSEVRVEMRDGHWRDWQPTGLRADDFGARNVPAWKDKKGWQFLLQIKADEFMDDRLIEKKGWEFLAAIET